MEVGDVVRLKQLESENLQMQRIIARQTLKIDAMDELIKKKRLGPPQRQEAVKTLQAAGLSQRETCSIVQANCVPGRGVRA
jgi:hypothetical protein